MPKAPSDRSPTRSAASSPRCSRREVHDPGIGFVTLTRVQVSPDLQLARVYYTALGDDKARGAHRRRSIGRRRSCAGRSGRGCGSSARPS